MLLSVRETGSRQRASPPSVEPYSPSSGVQGNVDNLPVPSYRPTSKTKLAKAEEYVPEYLPSSSDKKVSYISFYSLSIAFKFSGVNCSITVISTTIDCQIFLHFRNHSFVARSRQNLQWNMCQQKYQKLSPRWEEFHAFLVMFHSQRNLRT